jgi:hypothetical protein
MVFLSEAAVTVTSEQLIVGRRTYALSGVTSVRHERQWPSRLGPIATLLIGLGASGAGLGSQSVVTAYAGVVVLAIGLFWERSREPRYVVILSTHSGEVSAFWDWDQGFALRVVHALTEAIAGGE